MSDRISRRSTVLVVALLLVPTSVVAFAPGGSVSAQPTEEFSVTQAGQCTTVTPIGDGTQTVSDYYDYETVPQYSSHGTADEQASATSTLYFYRGSDGVSLVMLHDQLGDEVGGGTATFDVSGVPSTADWPVEDDTYEGRDDVFDHEGSSSHIEWVWAPNRTDGAALRGVGAATGNITIDPGFNEESAQWDSWPHTDEEDRIDTWRVLDGDGDAATTLDLSQPVDISPGPCAADAVPTSTATSTATASPSPTASPTTTTPTQTASPTPTQTASPTPTQTTSPAPTTTTSTATSTATPTASPTASPSPTPTTEESDDGGSDNGGGSGGSGGDDGSGVDQSGGLGIRDVAVDGDATVGSPANVTITVSNTDVVPHTREFTLRVDGEAVESRRVTVDSGERRTLTFTHTFESADSHEIRIGAQRATIQVTQGASTTTEDGTSTPAGTTPTPADATTSTPADTTTGDDREPLQTTGGPVERTQDGGLGGLGGGIPTSQLVLLGVVAVLGSIAIGTWVLGRD